VSFGLEEEHIEVQKAILEAFCKKILIFAAASNDGGNKRVTYPARKDEVICIYATDGLGTPFKGNPTTMSSGYNFATLGVGVKSAWPRECQDDPKPKKTEPSARRMTGTSFAAPIVAGIAACIVEFAYMHDFPETLLEKLKSRQGMQEILRKHMVDERQRSDLHYIHPWELFKGRTDEEVIVLISDVLKRS
jgi:subtilisin family serine protease